ncbi:MAG: ABC transporter permease, partial [Coriobacteriia bacterium]|nr:ABC transporter permease [Coriobacteriia bacterium]
TATLAAYTADIGLGRFLFAGMKTNHYEVMIGGALLVVALTLVLDIVLALCQKAVERRAG